MTKIFLPTELGVKAEGSHSGINDEHTPDVKEIDADETPGQKEQPEFYKRIRDIDEHELTLAEERTVTRNQVPYDAAAKDGEQTRKPLEANLNEDPSEKPAPTTVKKDSKTSDKKD